MDPVIDNEWLTCKNDPIEETQIVGNVARSWQWRERGINPPHCPSNKTVLENIAEDILVQKPLKIRCCDLPGYPRSTFLMVFSPDGTKVASTHGNHNVYVSELASGKHVRILKGHPRTPWCIAFHPSHTQLIGSGCLGGQVRVWDICSGGSEVWNVQKETVIASIAFHPREQLLVIATYNELYFWDWSQPAPFTRVSTNNTNEKVRYVAFDALGYKLITGISLWANAAGVSNASILHQNPTLSASNSQNPRRDDPDDSPSNRPPDAPGTAQDMIVNSYQNLVQRYDSLVRNYQRLFMVRHRLTNTPPPPNTIDRGTDPMETDAAADARAPRDPPPPPPPPPPPDAGEDDGAGAARLGDDGDSGGEGGGRLLNLDVLSFDPRHARNQDSQPEHSIFGSRSSAFQPLTESRSFRTVDQSERSTRLLPNPFSSNSTRSTRSSFSSDSQPTESSSNTSRTSIFTSSRAEALSRAFFERRRNATPGQNSTRTHTSVSTDDASPLTIRRVTNEVRAPSPRAAPSISTNTPQRPTMTNSSTQMSPITGPIDAQTINESLDLIRDILRDSGTRLLNLITNMSLSTLASVERSMPRRGGGAGTARARGAARPRVRLLLPRAGLHHDLLSSSSDSDSDQSLEVNIFRTRNSTFRDEEPAEGERPRAAAPAATQPTRRAVFDLEDELRREAGPADPGDSRRINVTLVNDRFRVRTHNESGSEDTASDNRDGAAAAADPGNEAPTPGPSTDFNPRPSTSRDFWNEENTMPPDVAYRRVKLGVNALQKHTVLLTNMWLRGNRITMRELRNMWENLRRRIITLTRDTGRQDRTVPSHYTRSLLERCMMLTDMTDNSRMSTRSSRSNTRSDASERSTENIDASTSNSNVTESDFNTSTDSVETRSSPRPTPQERSSSGGRSLPSLRRRLQSRWKPEDELRRRARNRQPNRLSPRTNTSRRDFTRAIVINATRHEIRMRAMQVLSVMFNMMMMCLEERGLSQLIISMLRTLKKALALTCLMLMMNRNQPRQGSTPAATAQRNDPQIVVRIQNVDDAGPVNVDGPDEPAPRTSGVSRPTGPPESNTSNSNNSESIPTDTEKPPTSQPSLVAERMQEEPVPSTSTSSAAQRWSNRLAVQIAQANRNNSVTARTRRDLYLESKRQKALHKTNPAAHPITKKRVLPPVTFHSIPALRLLPAKLNRPRNSTPRIEPRNDEAIAGPSNAAPQNDDDWDSRQRTLLHYLDSNRGNILRLAQNMAQNAQDNEPVAGPSNAAPRNGSGLDESRLRMLTEYVHYSYLVRMGNPTLRARHAARTRLRRLQMFRLYTPSSLREVFALQPNSSESPPGSQSPEPAARRSFATYRPHILAAPRGPGEAGAAGPGAAPGHFHTVLNNVAVPLVQVNDLAPPPPPPPDAPGALPSARLPRIHEYLQPIILAQNAMVVDEEGGGGGGGGPEGGGGGGARRLSAGMAGILDPGLIGLGSETLPVPSHRVQAWDFTTGDAPDIADSTKNVVVQRCRIHNDASIDISKDGRLLVALLPVPRLRNTNHYLGVYSLEWGRLGQCLHTAVLEQSPVSVALSPTARHLAVGLGSRRFTTAPTPHARNNVFALLYRLEPLESSSRTGLSPIKELEQNWEQGFTSLNCLRWAPQPGQGLVYANNTGQLIVMS